MAQTNKNYGLGEITVSLGSYLIDGVEDVNVEFPNAAAGSHVDGNGNVTRIINAGHDYCEITVSLSQTSESNSDLQSLYNETYVSGSRSFFQATVKDENGNTAFTIGEAFFMERPNSQFGKEDLNNRDWKVCGKAESANEGGN